MEMKIDAVITWVDGDDPAHKARMASYGNQKIFSRDDVAGSTRYASIGEICWCVASINRFAPFINKIYIITDRQDPHMEDFLQLNFPDGYIPVEIVDHTTIFRGYEEYLPVFNSLAIETMMWRIPGLSEHFIYFNDDFLLTAPLTPKDFFTPDGVVSYSVKYHTAYTDLTRLIKNLFSGRKHVTFKGMLRNGVEVAGNGNLFLHYKHTPRALLRSFYEEFFAAHPEAIVRNIRHRFRDADQYSTEEVQIISLYRAGRCKVIRPYDKFFFFQLKNKPNYLNRKMRKLNKGNYLFCCFNSLDKLSKSDQAKVIAWIDERLGIRSV